MPKTQLGRTAAHKYWPGLPPGEDPFRQFVDIVSDYAIYMVDRQGYIRSWNAGAERIKGYSAAEILGQPLSILYPPAVLERGQPQELLETAADSGRARVEGWRLRRDGSRFWAETLVTALQDPDGDVYGYAVITRDLTQKKRREDELRRSQDRSRRYWTAAISDSLTGAFNRRYFESHVGGDIDRGEAACASLLLFDIDHFKHINDEHGHDAGDFALRQVADVARRISRESDMLFRLGGDEFVLYLPGVDGSAARVIAERFREAVAAAVSPGGRPLTISIGVAGHRDGETLEAWLRNADMALYEAKQTGRNRVA